MVNIAPYLMVINLSKILEKNLVFVVMTLAVIAVGVLFWLNQNSLNQAKTYDFAGSVEKIEGSTVFATGFFSENGKPIPGKENQKESIEISVDSSTVLTRLAIKIPQGVTSFKIDDLEKEESLTDLETIKNDLSRGHVLGIETVLRKGDSNTKFIGKTLYFRVPIFSGVI